MTLTAADHVALFEQIKENRARLEACPGAHTFEAIDPTQPIGRRYRCGRCLGEVDAHAKYWYDRGIADGHLA